MKAQTKPRPWKQQAQAQPWAWEPLWPEQALVVRAQPSWCSVIRPAACPYTSSRLLRCGISRIALRHLFRRLGRGLNYVNTRRYETLSQGLLTFLSTCNHTPSASDQNKTSAQSQHTWVLLLELSQVIDILINHNPEVIRLAMRRDIFLTKCLGHFVLNSVQAKKESGVRGKEEEEKKKKKSQKEKKKRFKETTKMSGVDQRPAIYKGIQER